MKLHEGFMQAVRRYGRLSRTIKFVLVLALLLTGMVANRVSARPAAEPASMGTIAYVHATTGDEIRLIEPDGSNDRRLWTHNLADPQNVFDILALDWRSDAGELAFSSTHERTCSIFASDLYGIRPDGTGFRRVGNGPHCSGQSALPKGTVKITIRNETSKYNTNFYVYVQGAPTIVGVTVPWGGTATVTLQGVADYGAVNQWIALLHAGDSNDQNNDYRWLIGEVDVQPGQTVSASPNPATAYGDGAPLMGAWGPSWRRGDAQLGYAGSAADCFSVYAVTAVNPPPGLVGSPIITSDTIAPCSFTWGPTAATANQILFHAFPNLGMDGATFYLTTEGKAASSATKLFSLGSTNQLLWYDWLPDGKGFLFVRTTKMTNSKFVEANLFEYNIATKQITQISFLNNEFVRSFAVSPDGQTIVFERAVSLDSNNADLWTMNRNGTGMKLLVTNGRAPAWSSADLPAPLAHQIYLPFITAAE